MDMFEQYIMSYPAECGYGEKKELENTYYYAYMILITKPIAICRYVELTKKEYEQCREKYSQSYETDPISAQQFFIEISIPPPLAGGTNSNESVSTLYVVL